MESVREARCRDLRFNVCQPVARNLHRGTDFFVKERRHHRERILRAVDEAVKVHRHALMRRKHHFGQRRRQAAVALIVIGLDATREGELTNELHKAQEFFGFGRVRRFVTETLSHLSKNRRPHAGAAACEIKDRNHAVDVAAHFRGQREAHVLHGSRRRNDEGHGARHRLLLLTFRPRGLHGAGILPHGNRKARGLAVDARRLHGFVKTHVFTRSTASCHPVGRQLHQRRINVRRRDVRHGFGDRHTACGRRIEHRNRSAFTHRHRFAVKPGEVHVRHGAVRHRHLPGADVLIAGNQTAHAAVADRDEERLIGNRRVLQHGLHGVRHREHTGVKGLEVRLHALHVAVHARGFAEKHVHRHIHGALFAVAAFDDQFVVIADAAQHRVRATFTLTERIKRRKLLGRNRDHVAFLAFVAPDFQGAHALFFHGHLRQRKVRTVAGQIRQFGHGVGQPACAHVVNRENGVLGAARPAAVDHFLRPAFHFRVAALHGVKVKAFGVRTRRHRTGSAAA